LGITVITEQSDLVQQFVSMRPKVLAFVLMLTRDYHVAEEVVQELSVQVMREASGGARPDDPAAWVLGIARHRVTDFYRGRARDQRLAEKLAELAQAVEQSFVEQSADEDVADDRLPHLKACLARLSRKARKLVEARYGGGEKIEAIAERFAWQAASVRVALAKARRVLGDCVARKLAAGRDQ
jgi:RNA polymerase sigma-70 factor (ECF subfamily)